MQYIAGMKSTIDITDSVRMALRAAHLYYMQDLTMDAIAHELGTSRSTVSRLLSRAREIGLVDIQIRFPRDRAAEVQEEIQSRFGVSAHVVPVPNHVSDIDRLERVAMSAARTLGQFFASNMTIGVAWGSTIDAVSRHLYAKEIHHTEVVQLNGAGNVRSSGVDYASEILQRFVAAYGSQAHQFPVPAFFDDPATKQAMWRERSIQRVVKLQAHVDIALFSIGSPQATVPSHVYKGDYLDDEDYATLTQSGVVGDIATVFFRADGSSDNISINARSSGLGFDELRKVPRRICVVAGRAKLLGLRGALAAGLISDLVIDEPTARWIVREPRAEPTAR